MRGAFGWQVPTAAVLGALLLAGCQYNTEVGAVNRCGAPVEVDVVSSKESADDGPAGETLEAGERAYVRSVPESKDTVYVMVRRPETQRVVTRAVPVSDLVDPPDGADYEKQVEVSGDLCPR